MKKKFQSVMLIISMNMTSQVLGYLVVRKLDRYLNSKEEQNAN